MKKVQLFRKPLLLLSFLVFFILSFSRVTEQWVKRYNGPVNGWDRAADLAVDASGNVYVTGWVTSGVSDVDGIRLRDYATIKYDAAGNELWAKTYNGPVNGDDVAYSLDVDASGNVYVTGSITIYYESEIPIHDYATIKYDAQGNELWVKTYNGPTNGDDVAYSLTVDPSGNVYVTGESDAYPTINGYNTTIKYNTNGNELWVKTDNRSGGGRGTSLTVDASGNVYVAGWGCLDCDAFLQTYSTVKYDPAGNQSWLKIYNGSDNSGTESDSDPSLAVDGAGNVYVTGGDGTIKYDAAGNELWSKEGIQNSLAIDASGNLYVTGFSSTRKYDSNGIELWVKAGGNYLAVDAAGNVYVAGSSNGDYVTVKYDTNGNELWVKTYNGTGNSGDHVYSLAVDASGNVYVTGESHGNGTAQDYATIKYTQATALPVTVDAGKNKTLYLGYGPNCVTLSAQASEGTAPYKYSWSPGGGTSSSIKVCPTKTTTYTVTVTDANGQTASDEVKVNVIDVRCGNKSDKVLVCHNGKTLCISSNAVEAHLKHGDKLGGCSASSVRSDIESDDVALFRQVPENLRVFAAPNPFNTTTRIQYELPSSGQVSIKVYDVMGRIVATVVNGERKAGVYSTNFSADGLSNGVYYYRVLFTTEQKKVYTQTGKIMLVK